MGAGIISAPAQVDNVSLKSSLGVLAAKGGMLQYLETATPSGVNNFDFSTAINGDTDGEYVIMGQFKISGISTLQMRFNGGNAAGTSIITTNTGAAFSSNNSATPDVAGVDDDTHFNGCYIVILAKSGTPRFTIGQSIHHTGAQECINQF